MQIARMSQKASVKVPCRKPFQSPSVINAGNSSAETAKAAAMVAGISLARRFEDVNFSGLARMGSDTQKPQRVRLMANAAAKSCARQPSKLSAVLRKRAAANHKQTTASAPYNVNRTSLGRGDLAAARRIRFRIETAISATARCDSALHASNSASAACKLHDFVSKKLRKCEAAK